MKNIRPTSNRNFLLHFCGLLLATGGLVGCQKSNNQVTAQHKAAAESLVGTLVSSEGDGGVTSPSDADDVPLQIAEFCSDCHKLPQPTSFPRDVWYEEIRKGYEFYARSGRTDLKPPPPEQVVQFYRKRAPEKVVFPEAQGLSDVWAARFTTTKLDWKDGTYLAPAISSVQWLEFEVADPGVQGARGEGQGEEAQKELGNQPAATARRQALFATDMRDGSVSLITPARANSQRSLIGRLSNPARVNVCDYDNDGLSDLVVSDLGSFNPYDHPYGGVALLKQVAGSQFKPELVRNRIGRVADAIVGDFVGDERQEVVFAEFGHREMGGLHLLSAQVSGESNQIVMQDDVLDSRPGVVRVIADDVNGDGLLDFVTLTTQEYESVDVWVNTGSVFNRHPVWSAPDLACGSVSLSLVDIDGDGDNDMVVTCGDTFDNNYASLNHGVYLIENVGELQYESRRLLFLPGAYQVAPCDLDADGDMDIVAVANLPTTIKPLQLRERQSDSVVFLEQVESGQFESHVLRHGPARFSSVTAGDFDDDGRVDLAVGVQLFGTDPAGTPAAGLPRILVMWQD